MEAGQTIAGKYRLVRPLGAGGMASVWSATNVFTERGFAIKFMLPQVARTPEAARRFLLEAKVSGRLNHPNIVEMIDVGQTEDGSLFLVMELLSGQSLDDAIRRRERPMKVGELTRAMRDVAAALAEAHRMGVIHRDLKPTNVFLHTDRGGRTVPKLLDFGVSKVLKDDACEGALTAVGTILGSPFYMSPEQAMGADDVDGRTDVFAFGSILFEALTGERPYEASNLSSLLIAIATTPPKDIDAHAPQMPEPLRALVRDCLICDKTKRIASFTEVLERLDPLLASLEKSELVLPSPKIATSLSVDGSPSRKSDPPRRRTSDRPPPLASLDVGGSSPPISIPMSAPIFVPDRSMRLGAPISRLGRARPLTRSVLGVLAGAAAIVIVAGFVRHEVPTIHAVSGAAARQGLPVAIAATVPAPAASARDESLRNVPTVSVDALPVAPHGSAARAKGTGRLTITAKGGKCWMTIDGASRGATPLRAIELTAGIHQIDCSRPGERARTVSVAISEGNDAYYQFLPPE
ncbi:MAG TPA: serine/threonine-protein kinase [Polyangiaceae bacterium]|nr:serine/threonine-protein kinase [Polyangiaceae bacterium]